MVKNLSANTRRDMGSVPGSRRSPGVGNGNQLQFCFVLFCFVLFVSGKLHEHRSLAGYNP